MDTWRYFELTHARHLLMNPASYRQVDELGEVLELGPATRVLDVGCGHAEMLLRWHRSRGITGTGVDASPYHAARAAGRVARAGAGGALEVIHGRGEEFRTEERYDVACCVGASWIWNGHEGTLRALVGFAQPGGAVVCGEPYWVEPPPPEYLEAEGIADVGTFHTLGGCLDVARGLGLDLIWMAGSTPEDWDAYEMRQSTAVDAFARAHPADADLEDLRARRRRHEHAYLHWGRRCLGWAVWAFRVPRDAD